MPNIEFNAVENAKAKWTFVISLILTVLLGVGVVLLSEAAIFFLPFLIGLLALVFTLDRSGKRWLSLLLSFALILADLIFNPSGAVWGASAVILAAILTVWFLKNKGKAFFVGISTVILSSLMLLSVYLSAFSVVGFDVEAANNLLKTELNILRDVLVETVTSVLSVASENEQIASILSGGLVEETVELYMSMIPSFIVITALAVTAIANVVFMLAVGIVDKGRVRGADIFCTSSLFAVFFAVLSIFNLFENDGSTFCIALTNLYNVFLVVYAYVGFRFVAYFLGKKTHSTVLGVLIVLTASVLFGGFVINLLSVVGVFETFAVSRMISGNDINKREGGNGLE